MIVGLSGSLLSHDALAQIAFAPRDDGKRRQIAHRRMTAWHTALRLQIGPSAAAREVFDRMAVPLVSQLGYRVIPIASAPPSAAAILQAGNATVAVLVVTPWGHDAGAAWREAVRQGIACGVRWCLCVSGPALRIVDAVRTYSRRYAEFDLSAAMDDERTFAVFWELLAAQGAPHADAGLDAKVSAAVRLSEAHRAEVRGALQEGVHAAVGELLQAFTRAARSAPLDRAFDEALTVVYRILFLLFAEARGLVPRWHPLYRDSYTVERLRVPLERLPQPRGVWQAIQAVARLAHHGCRAGTLRVPPFNGRLFSPAHAPLADALPLDEGPVREALLSLTTRRTPAGRQRIAYADLGVEQLGGVYERLLDFEPAIVERGRQPRLVHAERRKTTGSFYTPRALTEYLVRQTLAPLVAGASPERILSLRVLDAAMGSGAFLVAACRYLTSAYEAALVADGQSPADFSDADRAAFRRTIAQRCLFGVDINPTAVQLARLSLWLATLAADRPLTFLDHHLRAGNSLAGASIADVMRRRPGRTPFRSIQSSLPLFPSDLLEAALEETSRLRTAIAKEPGDTIEQVRSKERALARLHDPQAKLAPWTTAADVWCAAWFDEESGSALAKAFTALADRILRGDRSLPETVAAPLLRRARETAARERFFHWTLEFPEVFETADAGRAGFDAVIGNPPWEMLRGDRGDERGRAAARAAASKLAGFARTSGTYLCPGDGHANLFQLFVGRALGLVRDGGRLGLVLPWGFAVDHGCAALRRHIFDRTSVDTFASLDNRDGVFPIHRSLKFLLFTTTTAGSTDAVPCRLGMRSPEQLDTIPDAGDRHGPLVVPRSLIERFCGSGLAVPEIRTMLDLQIVSSIAGAIPALGDADGWNVHFGRELNATEDRRHFTDAVRGLPVIEGKQIAPFVVDVSGARCRLPIRAACRLLDPPRTFRRSRLAYRDVASATNRITLIAAIVPRGTVTTHTLFCIKAAVSDDVQQFLCGMFNSYVANYLVRLRVTTHVSAAVIDRLPVPKPPVMSPLFQEVVQLSRRLSQAPEDRASAGRLQAISAHLYGIDAHTFRHILDTFPLVETAARDEALAAFAMLCRSRSDRA